MIMVAAKSTISEAAKELYIAQPSLTVAIRELEDELGIVIFHRLFIAKPHVFVSSASPLAGKKEIVLEDLAPIPGFPTSRGSTIPSIFRRKF